MLMPDGLESKLLQLQTNSYNKTAQKHQSTLHLFRVELQRALKEATLVFLSSTMLFFRYVNSPNMTILFMKTLPR